ncbi:MAG: OmpA family protein [Erythrobacter sp.]
MTKSLHRSIALAPLAALLTLSACDRGAAPNEDAVPNPDEPVSILRPDVEQPEQEPEPVALKPLNAVIGFPDGGAKLDEVALAALNEALETEQLSSGAPIILRAHSDAGGSDKVNADASQARGLAVAAWLIENGVDEGRIEVIVFGEQNPLQPNALPNGELSEKGRAANRRVELVIVPPKGALAKDTEEQAEADLELGEPVEPAND